MKYLAALLVLAAMLAPAANAVSQARDSRVPALQRRVATVEFQLNSMSRDVAAVRGDVAALRTQAEQLRTGLSYVNDKDTCSTAIVFDVFRALILGFGGGDIGRLDDKGACSRVGATRP